MPIKRTTLMMALSLAAVLTFGQYLAGRIDPAFIARAAAVVILAPVVWSMVPWPRIGRRVLRPKASPAWWFLLFTWHFAAVLLQETKRAYVAHRMSAPRRMGAWYWRSLVHATAHIFQRALSRAERFYAARLLDGI